MWDISRAEVVPAAGAGDAARDLHTVALTDSPDDDPVGRKSHVGREDGGQRVVFAAGQNPVERVRAELPGRRRDRVPHRKRSRVEFEVYAAGRGHMTQILKQTVADIEHGGRAEPGRLGTTR